MAATVGTNRAHAALPDLARRQKIRQIIVDLFKFAVGSAIDGSLKIIPGRKQADKVVPEGLINIPLPTPLKTKKKPDLKVANDIHLESKMEEVEEGMNNIKQQHNTSSQLAEEPQPPNKSVDDFKELNLPKKNERRVFIRSRL